MMTTSKWGSAQWGTGKWVGYDFELAEYTVPANDAVDFDLSQFPASTWYWGIATQPSITTITESFDQADSTTLGPDLVWVESLGNFETVSNKVRNTALATSARAIADSPLGSDDNYAQIVVDDMGTVTGGATVVWAAICRLPNASTYTGYACRVRKNSSSITIRLDRWVDGAVTALTAFSANYTGTFPATVRVEVFGSSVSGSISDGTTTISLGPVTDTNITTGEYAAFSHFSNPTPTTADNFEAGRS